MRDQNQRNAKQAAKQAGDGGTHGQGGGLVEHGALLMVWQRRSFLCHSTIFDSQGDLRVHVTRAVADAVNDARASW
jgi:hypothetical protein